MLFNGFDNHKEVLNKSVIADYGNCDFAINFRTQNQDGSWTNELVFFSTWAMSDNSCLNQAASAAGMFGTVRYRQYHNPSIYEFK